MQSEENEIQPADLVDHPYNNDRKIFTEKGITKLIELMTIGDIAATIQGNEIVLSAYQDNQTISGVLQLDFNSLVFSSLDQIDNLSPEEATVELFALAKLLQDAADHVERVARGFEEPLIPKAYSQYFSAIGEKSRSLYLVKNGEDDQDF